MHDDALAWAATGAAGLAALVAGIRWLRVAQREHYLPDATTRFAFRWWRSTPFNVAGVLVALAALPVAVRYPAVAFAPAAIAVVGPVGLGLRGRSAKLAWTRRLRTLAAVYTVLEVVVVGIGLAVHRGPTLAAAGAVLSPAIVDIACQVTAPFEELAANRFVRRASVRLRRVKPTVVAITGSYGKTSTKTIVAHLLGGSHAVVASPASFNNRAGLARAVNEHLAEGTEIFVAEMGTYGRGEIAELCRWLQPAVSVITAIGPVHLERFKSEDRIVAAKAEILNGSPVAVLATDDERLEQLAVRHVALGQRAVRCSARDESADVCVLELAGGELRVSVRPRDADASRVEATVPAPPGGARASNVACALGVVVALGADVRDAIGRLASLPPVSHRLEPTRLPSGVRVLDDTYNSNPAGATAALRALEALGDGDARRVVVTPGMVELGRRQRDENRGFAAAAAAVASDVVIVGRTNRKALLAGASEVTEPTEAPSVVVVPTREAAVSWVREHTGEGDVVLYENDLPDHYP